MAKLVLNSVGNILGNPTSAQTTINTNSDLIEAAIENTLSRNGATPNQMLADIDLNNNDLLNVGILDAEDIIYKGEDLEDTLTELQEAADQIDVKVAQATAQADRAKNEADRSKSEADRSERARNSAEAFSLSASLSASNSANSASFAQSSADRAELAAEVSGNVVFFDNYSSANSAVSGLPEGQIVEVIVDETKNNDRTRYRVVGGALIYKITVGGIPEKAPYVLKSAATFDVLSYIRNIDKASADAVQASDLTGQDGDKVLSAVRAAGDDMMTYVRSRSMAGAKLLFPAGVVGMKDELFSDNFQSLFWSQSGLLKGRHMLVEGAGADISAIRVRSDYVSAVRNTLNGNQRNYGPWAGQPSPSILIPALAYNAAGAPSALSVQKLRLYGTNIEGVDPVAWMVSNELDARHWDLHIQGFANSADWLQGSFNSMRAFIHVESCGAQPVDSGIVLGNPAGFPPPWVKFDLATSGGVTTVTAKAAAAYGGYAIGDQVPYFKSGHVGKQFNIGSSTSIGGSQQVCRFTITSVPIDGGPTCTMTPQAGATLVSGGNVTNRAGSFYPVKATTTADSTAVSLSSPIKIGRGARDMIGQQIVLPKAGSKASTGYDCYVGRVVGVTAGDDTSGYTGLTLSEPVRAGVTTDFIWSAAHAHMIDETIRKLPVAPFDLNDTDFVQCRWENSGGYGEDRSTSAYQWIVQGAEESVQYLSCKIHGGNPVQGQYAAEGHCIIDNCNGLQMIAADYTHFGLRDDGAVWLMGAQGKVRLVSASFGGWQLGPDFCALYIDPQVGFNLALWGVQLVAPDVKNTVFPNSASTQEILRKGPNLSSQDLSAIMHSDKERGDAGKVLTSSDDLNLFLFDTVRRITSSIPANTPAFTNNSIFISKRMDSSRVYQIILNPVTGGMSTRGYNSGTWGVWKEVGILRTTTTADLQSITSDINTKGKRTGEIVRNTTTGGLAYASGSNAADPWSYINRDGLYTPV